MCKRQAASQLQWTRTAPTWRFQIPNVTAAWIFFAQYLKYSDWRNEFFLNELKVNNWMSERIAEVENSEIEKILIKSKEYENLRYNFMNAEQAIF